MNVIYKVQINTDKLRIRAEDSTESAVIGSLKRGQVVECSYKSGGWMKLATQEGWIAERYVKILSEEEEDIDDEVVDDPADEDADDDAWMTVLKRLDAIEARLAELEG